MRRILSSSNGRTLSLFQAGVRFTSELQGDELDFLSSSDNGGTQKPSVLRITPSELAAEDT